MERTCPTCRATVDVVSLDKHHDTTELGRWLRAVADHPVPEWELAARRGYAPLIGEQPGLDANSLDALRAWFARPVPAAA